MRMQIRTLLCAAGVLAMAACTPQSARNFHSEAGAELDEGGFGNPTMQNMLAQKCTGMAKGYIVPDPIVVRDPRSTPARPLYYRANVRCSGELNGKYAQVIFREYVASAREAISVTETTVGTE
jgi:hypothetical protein